MKTLVIRELTELTECGHNIREDMKATPSETKEIYRETTVEGRKPGFKSMIWNIRKISIQPEQKKE